MTVHDVPRWTVVGAFALTVLIAVADAAFGSRIILIGALSLGPLVASLRGTTRQTLAVAVCAVLVAIVLGRPDAIFGTIDHGVRVGVVLSASLVALFAAEQRMRREVISQQLLEVVEIAQEVMLRRPPARIAHVGMAAYYASASDLARVGGDLYETAFTPQGVRMVLGDVRGKGLEAVRLAATVLAAFRENVWQPDLLAVARSLDECVIAASDDEEFVTALLVEIPPEGGVSIVNLGHHAPLRISAGVVSELAPAVPVLPLGLGPRPRLDTFEFLVGDRLLLFTDGLVEARDEQGRFFPLEDLTQVLRADDLQQALGALVEAVQRHVPGRLNDDMALLLTERLPVSADNAFTRA